MLGKCFEVWKFCANVSQLFNDIQTFHSEVKKIASQLVLAHYDISALSTAETNVKCLQAIKDKASGLLHKSRYLHGEQNALVFIFCASFHKLALIKVIGKGKQFHASGHETYMPSSTKALCQFPEFQESIPGEAIILISTIVNHSNHFLNPTWVWQFQHRSIAF